MAWQAVVVSAVARDAGDRKGDLQNHSNHGERQKSLNSTIY